MSYAVIFKEGSRTPRDCIFKKYDDEITERHELVVVYSRGDFDDYPYIDVYYRDREIYTQYFELGEDSGSRINGIKVRPLFTQYEFTKLLNQVIIRSTFNTVNHILNIHLAIKHFIKNDLVIHRGRPICDKCKNCDVFIRFNIIRDIYYINYNKIQIRQVKNSGRFLFVYNEKEIKELPIISIGITNSELVTYMEDIMRSTYCSIHSFVEHVARPYTALTD